MNGIRTISFKVDNLKFNYRVAGIAIHNNKILLHKNQFDNFWSLPGGRADFLEFSKDTLTREFQEEINQKIEIINLSWVVENLYEHNFRKVHEIGFYYHIKIPEIETFEDKHLVEGGLHFVYHWFELDEIERLPVYPDVINLYNLKQLDKLKHFFSPYENLDLKK